MKAYLEVGNEAIVMECKDALCIQCANCDLEEWEKNNWGKPYYESMSACKTSGVCRKNLIACNRFKPRTFADKVSGEKQA